MSERDHNGERGLIPYRSLGSLYLYEWRRARWEREYLDALRTEMARLNPGGPER